MLNKNLVAECEHDNVTSSLLPYQALTPRFFIFCNVKSILKRKKKLRKRAQLERGMDRRDGRCFNILELSGAGSNPALTDYYIIIIL